MKYDTEQIERYLKGELLAGEAKAFELRMTEDRDLAYEVQLHQTAIEAVQYAVLRKRTTNIRHEMEAQPATPITRRLALWGSMAVAATLLVFFLFRFLMPSALPAGATVDQTFAQVFDQINSSNTTMGTENPTEMNTDSIYQLGINFIKQEKYTDAHKEFDLLIAEGKKRPEAAFNKAYAYWKAKDDTAAKQQLEEILGDENTPKKLKEKAKYIMDNLE